MNKNARKLIPAVAMLLVSATMLSTASFAWFSMNSQVKATGMNVNVAAPANLMISADGTDGSWKTEVEAVISGEYGNLLGHASSVDGTTVYMVSPEDVEEDGSLKNTATIKTVDNSNYATDYGVSGTVGYVDYTFYLATTATSTMDVTLDPSVTKFESSDSEADTVLINAMRFAVLIDDNAPEVNNVWCGATNDVEATEALSGLTEGGTDVTTAEKFTTGSVLATLDAGEDGDYGEATKVTIRIWLEGTSASAINSNITYLKQYTLTVGFMVVGD